MHISVVADRLIIVVVFDRRSPWASSACASGGRPGTSRGSSPPSRPARRGRGIIEELTDADIESLFK